VPALKNPQQEMFALNIARGGPVAETYAKVYPGHGIKNPDLLAVKASKLHTRPHIQARIAEMKDALAVRTTITQQKVLEELAKIGFANYGDFVEIDADGKTTVDVNKLTKDQLAAISEMQVETTKDGRQRVRVKLHDKRAALVDIGKHLGMFREKIEVSGPNGGPIQTQNAIEVSLLAKEERDMLRQILLVAAERKAERERQEMKTIEHQKGE